MYVLQDLWDGNIRPSERAIRYGSTYADLYHQATEAETKFRKEMTEKGRSIYEDYCNKQNQLLELSEADAFIQGFRLGARIILDVIGAYNSPLPPMAENGDSIQ